MCEYSPECHSLIVATNRNAGVPRIVMLSGMLVRRPHLDCSYSHRNTLTEMYKSYVSLLLFRSHVRLNVSAFAGSHAFQSRFE